MAAVVVQMFLPAVVRAAVRAARVARVAARVAATCRVPAFEAGA